jgi:hypothetical protein
MPKGRLYCQEYFENEDSWGINDLYECFSKYNVDFGKEFCDSKFSDDKVMLMQCYAGKSVERGEEFCVANFDKKTEKDLLLLCYELIPLFTMDYCRLKYAKDPDAKVDCFKNKAKVILDKPFCDSLNPIDPELSG